MLGERDSRTGVFASFAMPRAGDLMEQLAQCRLDFERLVSLSSDWYWETDAHMRVTQIIGKRSYMQIGLQFWDGSHPEEALKWRALRAMLDERNPFREHEFRVLDLRDGKTVRWVSCAGEPVFDGDGQFLGYRGIGRDITEKVTEKAGLWTMANLDGLTGLPNRMKFCSDLESAVERSAQTPFVLALVDLDHFKTINDTYGHDAGDKLLLTMAERLRGALRSGDTLARLGGDEFAVIMRNIESGSGLTRPLDAMIASMAEPLMLGDHLVHGSISVGATLCPTHADNAEDLLKNADIALYESKGAGRGQYTVFRSDMREKVERKNRLSNELESALDNGHLRLHYQPIVCANGGGLKSLEALLRWEKPSAGVVEAGRFQEVFTNSNLAARIGRFVTESSVRQLAEWAADGFDCPKVSINVTSADFTIGDFPGWLSTCLAKYGVPSCKICVEVTEGMFLGNSAETVNDGLEALGGMGCEIAFDDYGTGFASLMHLRLPVHNIKIDKMFVRGLGVDKVNEAIVSSVTSLAKQLGKTITVEGVETISHMAILRQMGCDRFQGYGISKALPASDVPGFAAKAPLIFPNRFAQLIKQRAA